MMNSLELLMILNDMFPDAKCDLDYHDHFSLLVAVMLSAQTTDKSVNLVTPALLKHYPDAFAMAKAQVGQVEFYLKSLGLYKNKSKHLIAMAQQLVQRHNGIVPSNHELLTALPGVGDKTANVILAEGFMIPAIAVDTHVQRVAKRLGLADEVFDVHQVEKALMTYFPKDQWIKAHHLLIYFGRYFCKAVKPQCSACPLRNICVYIKKDQLG
jgi:endonuclease III